MTNSTQIGLTLITFLKNKKKLGFTLYNGFLYSLCISRGNSKVKTTQELIAGLQNKNASSVLGLPPLNSRPKEDLSERAAKLTERVSLIDQRLYTSSNRSKQKNRFTSSKLNSSAAGERNDRVIESGSVINDKSLKARTSKIEAVKEEDDEIIVVDDVGVDKKVRIRLR